MKRTNTIPTVIGVLLLLGGLIAGVFAVKQGQTWFIRAAPEEQPKEVRITNLSDNSFTVSWITDTKVRGFVKYGDSGGALPEIASDSKDNGRDSQGAYEIHYVNVKGLKADTDYEFKLGSGKRLYDDSGKAFVIKTAALIQASPGETDLITGSVTANGVTDGMVVYLETERLTPLSGEVKPSGTFTIPLTGARSRDLKEIWSGPQNEETFELLIEGASLGRATASINMKNRDRLPAIAVPGHSDFLAELPRDNSGGVILPTGSPTGSPTTSADITPTIIPGSRFTFARLPTPTESDEISLIYPTVGETVNVVKPEFMGVAPPGKSLTVTVESTPQSQQVVTNSDGEWKWTPPLGLEPGEHTFTISYVDKTGALKKIIRKFTVSAAAAEPSADNSLGFTASPSATLAPSPTRAALTLTPTVRASASATPTVTPTKGISPTTRAGMPATASGIPVSGTTEVTLALVAMGLMLIGSGVLLLGMRTET